ncbi:DUF4865 domain-containing protein [Streptomyces sulfonofaciens]|uniref:DUF4865 domain-containing protein n=1 Tax=Streptomyces sulfonofaciens TaxID=68272 RepID=A0A919FU07_9ACTN|nr:DUF4865 family protein [Streptomyces sulfonofaciens]GHH72366.1 DUF4865 domain-containing protein [Streptomyces sulfonofaciens]
MHVMQYEITLPADYDMAVIRDRVATRGPLLDDFPGLGVKAYLIRERGVQGSPVNQYAPFYLWGTHEGMHSFLWGPGFRGVAEDFGRPAVRQWTGLAYEEGAAAGDAPLTAVRRRERISADAPLTAFMEDTVRATARLARQDGVVYAALAVDPRRWELVHFSAWAHDAPHAAGEVYRVLRLSAPERHLLPRGRQW